MREGAVVVRGGLLDADAVVVVFGLAARAQPTGRYVGKLLPDDLLRVEREEKSSFGPMARR